MELTPTWYQNKTREVQRHVLKLLTNLYRQKQAGHIWNQYMTHKFKDTVFSAGTNWWVCILPWCHHFIVYMGHSLFWGIRTTYWCSSSDSSTSQGPTLKIKAIPLTTSESTSKRHMMACANYTMCFDWNFHQWCCYWHFLHQDGSGQGVTLAACLLWFNKIDGNFNYHSAMGKLNYIDYRLNYLTWYTLCSSSSCQVSPQS